MTNKINVLKDLQEHMKDKYAITGLSKYRDYYASIGEAIGEMQALDKIVKKNNELKKELEIAIGCIKDCGDCPVGQCDGYAKNCDERIAAYFKEKAGIDESSEIVRTGGMKNE